MLKKYAGVSFSLRVDFKDEDGLPITPDDIEYEIINEDGVVIESDEDNPTETWYKIKLTTDVNTLDEGVEVEERKVIIAWTFNEGTEGDVKVFTYKIEKP